MTVPATAPARPVPDDVWAEIDPAAGRLSPRTIRRCWRLAAGLLVLTVLAVATWWLGLLFSTRLTAASGSGGGARRHSHFIDVTFGFSNTGRLAADISSISAGSGLAVTSVHGLPHHLASGASATVSVRLRITDCRQARGGSVPVTIEVKRLWWHVGKTLDLPFGSLVTTACGAPLAARSG